jgi:hypothetical protein
MKKNSLVTIKTALTNFGFADEDIMAELTAEINKGEEQRAKNAAVYASFHDIVMKALSEATAPVTIAELWDVIEADAPEGVTKGKLQYAVTRLWKDEITKIDGNPNSYTKA